jgi:hypothetical protein
MGILLLFAIGGALGLASNRYRPSAPPRPLLDVALAIMAALAGGLFVAPRIGFPSLGWGGPDGRSILVAIGAAMAVLTCLYGVRRATAGSA